MSNIDPDSLVFALPDEDDPDADMIMCQMPTDMIMNWMKVVHPHAAVYTNIMEYYTELALRSGIDDTDAAIYEYSNNHGMREDIQGLMMDVIMDLKELLGLKEFLELWGLETDNEDKNYLSSQKWFGMNNDGSKFSADMKNESPIKH